MEVISKTSKSVLSSLVDGFSRNRSKNNLNLLTELGQSAQEFTSRMKSYRRWLSKPVEVSPWWCSRYGWYCIEKDLLQCVGCRQYLSAHLPSAVDDDVLHRKSTDRLRALLIDAHSKTCVWRSNMTEEDVCSPNISDYRLAFIDFVNRAQSLGSFFPIGGEKRYLVAETLFDHKSIAESDIDDLIETIKTSDIIDTDQNISKDACTMALLGWRLDESCKECVCCNFCLRRIGLWLFRAETISPTEETSVVGNLESVQQKSPKNEKRLDPIGQHHKWCPWVMAVPSSSALYVSPKDVGESSTYFVPTWLALFRLLTNRGLTNESSGKFLNKDEVSEHYVLAKQLLDETLERIESLSDQQDVSTSIEENNISI